MMKKKKLKKFTKWKFDWTKSSKLKLTWCHRNNFFCSKRNSSKKLRKGASSAADVRRTHELRICARTVRHDAALCRRRRHVVASASASVRSFFFVSGSKFQIDGVAWLRKIATTAKKNNYTTCEIIFKLNSVNLEEDKDLKMRRWRSTFVGDEELQKDQKKIFVLIKRKLFWKRSRMRFSVRPVCVLAVLVLAGSENTSGFNSQGKLPDLVRILFYKRL